MKRKQNQKRMDYWKDRIENAKSAWEPQRSKMDTREAVYRGDPKITRMVEGDEIEKTVHVYNIVAENIESIVDPTIYQPKVTAMHAEDDGLAKMIEHMISNELDRLPMEEINDQMERTVPIQGGGLYWPEWDDTYEQGGRRGAIKLGWLHPKQLIPQDGVYTSVDDMDFVAVIIPQTQEGIRRKYGISVRGETESDPQIKGAMGESSDTADSMVSQYLVYYKNNNGGIGRYSWVNDIELEDYEDYQARHIRRCKKCGAMENTDSLILERATQDGEYPEGGETGRKPEKGRCPYCGSTEWEDSTEEFEEILVPAEIGGETVGGTEAAVDELGNVVLMATAKVPYYKPNCFPLILQKNTSVYGQLLGESDVDKISDQQNTLNRLSEKIIRRILEAGSMISLPPDTRLTIDPSDNKKVYLESIADKEFFGVYEFTGNLQYEMAFRAEVYQESRNVLGITDSFQGRQDSTATSGKAKQFSAQQSAGRMESKRVMKRFAYSRLFEMIFKLMLAYCDEKRPVIWKDQSGKQQYEEFDRKKFLKKGPDGEWYWNTDFLFSVDDSGGLAQNRTAMWNELTSMLTAGALGNPQEIETLISYWRAMEELHYPGAGKRMAELTERKKNMTKAHLQAAMAVNTATPQPAAQAAPLTQGSL